jgi:tetratricopeptide (TPR) repeat protein
VLKVLATVVLFALIGIFLEPERVWVILKQLQPQSIVTVVGLSLIGLAIQWKKWHLLLKSVRPQTTAQESLHSLLVGFALGLASPGRIGELGRGLILSSDSLSSDSRAASTGAATADRLCSAAISIALGLTAFVWLTPVPGTLVAVALCAITLVGFRLVTGKNRGGGGIRDSPQTRSPLRAFMVEAMATMVRVPRGLWLRSLGLSLAFQILLCFQFLMLATDWMDSSTELWLAIPIIFAAKALLPIAFLDLGVREAASVFVFAKLNFDPAIGFNCAILLYAINVVVPAIAGTAAWALSAVTRNHCDSSACGQALLPADPGGRKNARVLGQALALWLAVSMTTAGSELSAQENGTPPMVRLIGEGDLLAERGQIQAAIEKYEQARSIGAGSSYVLNRLAQLYLMSSRPHEAIDLLHKSLSESRGQLPVYSMLGESFLAIGQIDSALAWVNEARELAPEVSSIRSYLGLLHLQRGRPQLAKAQLDTAISFDSGNAEAYRFFGIYYTQLDSLDSAISSYEKVIELQQRDVEAHNNIAFLHSRLKRYGKSLDYYRRTKSLTTDPNVLHSININMEAVRAIMNGKLRARYILVHTEAKGRELLKRLQNGEEFADLAVQFSKAPNAQLGGDLGYFGPGDMVAEVEEAVLQLEPGELSDLISLQQGTMILQRLN